MFRTFLALTLALAAGACAGKRGAASSTETAYDSSVREKVLESEGLVRQDIDLDTDGQPEIFNFFRERADAPRRSSAAVLSSWRTRRHSSHRSRRSRSPSLP